MALTVKKRSAFRNGHTVYLIGPGDVQQGVFGREVLNVRVLRKCETCDGVSVVALSFNIKRKSLSSAPTLPKRVHTWLTHKVREIVLARAN